MAHQINFLDILDEEEPAADLDAAEIEDAAQWQDPAPTAWDEIVAHLQVDLAVVEGERRRLEEQVVKLRAFTETVADETDSPCRVWPDCLHVACAMVDAHRDYARSSLKSCGVRDQ